MRGNRLIGSAQTPGSVMVVPRMKPANMNEIGRGITVQQRHLQHLLAHPIGKASRPTIGAGHQRHPFGAQSEQFHWKSAGILQDLHIGIAMQQQLAGQRFQQGLPRAGRLDQIKQQGVGMQQMRPRQAIGNQAHCTMRHRVFQIGAFHRNGVFEWGLPARIGENPGRHIAARQRHPVACALECARKRGSER